MKIRTLAAIAGLLLGATGCTPQEVAFWTAWHAENPKVATSFLAGVHCYSTPGGTLCAVDGTEEAALYADLQRRLHDGVGVPDPGPGPLAPGYEVAPIAPVEQPPTVRCFILIGGTFCYEEGTPDYERAAIEEAAYLATDHNLVPVEQRPLP